VVPLAIRRRLLKERIMKRIFAALLLSVSVTACTTSTLPKGESAYRLFPPANSTQRQAEYKIGPLDVLKITVFQEADLSLEEVPVDASGNILLPLIGQVEASQRTTAQLAQEIAARLEVRYLVDPQVSIIIEKSASQIVTVEGSVEKPGVFEIQGSTTLLQAIALAQGPKSTAQTSDIIVFRNVGDQVYAARFDLNAIRAGTQPNPEVLGNDTVVVGSSAAKSVMRDFLAVLPLLTTVFVLVR